MPAEQQHEHDGTSLHKRVGVLEEKVAGIMEWKPTITSSIHELGVSMDENTIATKETLSVVTNVDGILRGDLGGKSPGLHAEVRDLKIFAGSIRAVLGKIASTLIVALAGGAITGIVWLIRHMAP